MKNDTELMMYEKKFRGEVVRSIGNDTGNKKIILITGRVARVSKEGVVGYCNYYMHRGALTKKLLEQHQCIEKGCTLFKKCPDAVYWVEKQKKHDESVKLRERKRAEEVQQKALDEARIKEAQNIADLLGYEMKVIQIRKTKGKKHFVMFYISDRDENDWYRFVDLAREFGHSRWAYVELRHIKDKYGNYVTF